MGEAFSRLVETVIVAAARERLSRGYAERLEVISAAMVVDAVFSAEAVLPSGYAIRALYGAWFS